VARKKLLAASLAAATFALTVGPAAIAGASSHREAPMISQDPVADNTDVYLFRDVTDPTMVNVIADFIGLEDPNGGPNFAKFGDDVAYEIHIDNNGDAVSDITYQFRFRTVVVNPNTFLYNTNVIAAVNDAGQNVQQLYSVQRINKDGSATMLATDLPTPPVNVGVRSTNTATPYATLAASTVKPLPGGGKVFAGQRDDPFFVDTGSIFDLLGLRPINNLHLVPLTAAPGVDGLAKKNVHSIALQLPISAVSKNGNVPTTVDSKDSVIGVYASTSRQRVKVLSVVGGAPRNAGRWVQVSRLGVPLVNEVLIPLGKKDLFNSANPADDAQFFSSILDPEPTKLLPVLYPGVFNNTNTPKGGLANRPDLVALLTGHLAGLSPANALPPADLLRLNLAVAPVQGTTSNGLGALQGDAGGFPNGRRLSDDVVDIELQVLAGVLLAPQGPVTGGGGPGFDNTGVPYSALSDGVGYNADGGAELPQFPYVGTPWNGYGS
jgi:hypothetical protein